MCVPSTALRGGEEFPSSYSSFFFSAPRLPRHPPRSALRALRRPWRGGVVVVVVVVASIQDEALPPPLNSSASLAPRLPAAPYHGRFVRESRRGYASPPALVSQLNSLCGGGGGGVIRNFRGVSSSSSSVVDVARRRLQRRSDRLR
ncbi:unnamed protein product [Lampetra planeri]